DDVVAVDCGLMFPDPDELPGIDYVIPDFSYAVAKRDGFRAVLLTHGHEDHIGALPYLLRTTRIPVYGTPLTLALVAEKLREHNLLETADLRPMKPHDRIEAGPFRIEPIRVTNSIADGIGLAIEPPVGTIAHTGTSELDPSPLDGETPDYKRFTELGEHGVLLLCSDSTNVGRPGHTRSELDVGVALRERFQRASGRIVVATFASHIHRIQQVLTLAAEHGRRVALLGMSMEKNVRVASDLGYLRVPADLVYEDNAFVHVSGHASQEDLKLMLNLTRPRYFMPVHGEYRHLLGHARLAESVGLASDRVFLVEDGAVVEMTKTAARVIGHLP